MSEAQTNLLIQLAVSAGITISVAFLAAHWAAHTTLKRFYKERMWERKANAYTTILEALHLSQEWYGKHFDAAITKRDLTEEYAQKLTEQSATARTEMMRAIEGQTWLLSPEVHAIIKKMDGVLDDQYRSWEEDLDHGWGAVRDAREAITKLARADLAIDARSDGRLRAAWLKLRATARRPSGAT